jgi:hypothetical protein
VDAEMETEKDPSTAPAEVAEDEEEATRERVL